MIGRATRRFVDELLAESGVTPILVDVGASAGTPNLWEPLARHAVYVGFDPDTRDLPEIAEGRFRRAVILNQVVTADSAASDSPFHYTQSPYCSSVLSPSAAALEAFLFADLFDVSKVERVGATTLPEVMSRLSLPRIDWLKVDTQGTDLRIFMSLPPQARKQVLALDIEPGLIDAYEGEDLFEEAHRAVRREGYWLSNLTIGGAIRLRTSTLPEVTAFDPRVSRESITERAKRTPAWCEARYLREIASLDGASSREYLLLGIFAVLDEQWGFAFEVAAAYERRFSPDDMSQCLKSQAVLHLRALGPRPVVALARAMLPGAVKRRLKRLIS